MKKLKSYIDSWLSGKNVRGIYVSVMDIHECIYIYSEIQKGLKPMFINGNVKKILDICGIRTRDNGIGWKVA